MLSGKVMSVEYLEGVGAGDLPSLMPVCPPLSSPSTPPPISLPSLCVFGLFLWVPSYTSVSSLPPGPPPSVSGSDLLLLLGLSLSLHFLVLAFCSLFLSPWLTLDHFCVYVWSLAPLSPHPCLSLSSLVLASAPPSLHPSLCWILPLCLTFLSSWPLALPL